MPGSDNERAHTQSAAIVSAPKLQLTLSSTSPQEKTSNALRSRPKARHIKMQLTKEIDTTEEQQDAQDRAQFLSRIGRQSREGSAVKRTIPSNVNTQRSKRIRKPIHTPVKFKDYQKYQ